MAPKWTQKSTSSIKSEYQISGTVLPGFWRQRNSGLFDRQPQFRAGLFWKTLYLQCVQISRLLSPSRGAGTTRWQPRLLWAAWPDRDRYGAMEIL